MVQWPAIVRAADIIPGPVVATVISVYDGDTLTVNSYPWPGMTIRTAVRVNGIDTPEMRGLCRGRCRATLGEIWQPDIS